MLKKRYIFIIFLLLTGCGTATNESINEGNRPQPHQVRNETPWKEHLTYYEDHVDVRKLQKENLADNDFNHYTDPYTTEESQEIAKGLMENRDIIVAEVRVVDERVFVAVRLRENIYDRNHDMSTVTTIEDQVKELMGDDEKQVIVWTDHAQWSRMKNHYSEPKMNPIFDNFFKDNQ